MYRGGGGDDGGGSGDGGNWRGGPPGLEGRVGGRGWESGSFLHALEVVEERVGQTMPRPRARRAPFLEDCAGTVTVASAVLMLCHLYLLFFAGLRFNFLLAPKHPRIPDVSLNSPSPFHLATFP